MSRCVAPGNVTAVVGAVGILRRPIAVLRHFLAEVSIRVRLSGGFAHLEVLALLDAEANLEYVMTMAKNAVLKRKAKPAMRQASKLSRHSGQTEHVYSEAGYAAGTSLRPRRVIIKAEVVRSEGKAPKGNPRFLITNLQPSPQWIYEQVYCQHGEIENRSKLRPAKALELNCLAKEDRSDRSKPSDNVPTLVRAAPEPRGDGVSVQHNAERGQAW